MNYCREMGCYGNSVMQFSEMHESGFIALCVKTSPVDFIITSSRILELGIVLRRALNILWHYLIVVF